MSKKDNVRGYDDKKRINWVITTYVKVNHRKYSK